jgi:M6 family metalloprotease-like protein
MMDSFSRRHFLAGSVALGLAQMGMPALASDRCAPRRGLVILADFPGLSRSFTKEFAIERFRKLEHYVQEMSYGKTCAVFDFTDWHQLPEPISSYSISPANLKVDKSRVFKLIQDAIDAADDAYEFSRYDFLVLFMRARFEDYGMVGLCGYPGMLGWQQKLVFKTKRRGQIVPNGLAIYTASAHVGTLFHDIAHIWGGVVDGKRMVPCLYDHDLQEKHPTRATGWENALINMGYWDPMSCHFYQPRLPPPGLSSWTKLRLGWLPSEKVRTIDPAMPTEVLLGPLEDGDSATLAIRIPLTASRYLLIENRQPIGDYDRVLPKHGVLIMKADDDVRECRYGKSPVRLVDANPKEKALLGAAFDLPEQSQFIDPEFNIKIQLMEKVGSSYRIRVGKTD